MFASTKECDFVKSMQPRVDALLRRVAEKTILPRFQRLRDADIIEKSPGEVVTVADREAEAMFEETLSKLLPGSRVIGEEACAADESLMQRLDEGLVWIVDPIDGTAHFAAGREPFGTMIALAVDGVVVGGWIYHPIRDLLFKAILGEGAFVRGANCAACRLRTSDPVGAPIAGLATQFMMPELRTATLERAERAFQLHPIPRCAAEHYPRLCRGENHLALFQRTLPWDHAAGALLLIEAGGHVARWDGTPYHFHDDGVGILAAASSELWEEASEVLFSGTSLREKGHLLLPPNREI